MTAAYGGSAGADDLVLAAATVGAGVGASLRIASFAVWARPAYTTRLGTDPEDDVLAGVDRDHGASRERRRSPQVEGLPDAPAPVETVIGRGASWAEAIDDVGWDEGDVLVVGSSELGPVAQVFLGSRATKILRHSPVPVFVVPRRQGGGRWRMHEIDQTTEQMVRSVLAYAENRLRMDPVPLDMGTLPAERAVRAAGRPDPRLADDTPTRCSASTPR